MTAFFDSLTTLEEQISNKMAWDRFLALKLPEKKTEAFRYFPLRAFYEEAFVLPVKSTVEKTAIAPFILPEAAASHLVFVDGVFAPHLSCLTDVEKQVIVLPLEEAMRTYGAFLKNRLAKLIPEEKNPFAALNLALASQGVFVYVPPRTEVGKPIQCLQITTQPKAMVVPRVHLFVGAGADVAWITHHVSLQNASSWSNGIFDIALEEGAHCHHTQLTGHETSSWHFDALRATLKKEAHLESFHFCLGGRAPRLDAKLWLTGENGNADLQGLWALSDKQQAHMYTTIEHEAPACRSMQKFKGVLKDFSQSSFEGKIFVHPIAQKTEAYQLNNNLILNEGAFANTKPNLEIFADDVKASHGATVTQLRKEELFYLKTRGLSEALSKKLLVTGFCQEIVEHIPYASMQASVRRSIHEMLQ